MGRKSCQNHSLSVGKGFGMIAISCWAETGGASLPRRSPRWRGLAATLRAIPASRSTLRLASQAWNCQRNTLLGQRGTRDIASAGSTLGARPFQKGPVEDPSRTPKKAANQFNSPDRCAAACSHRSTGERATTGGAWGRHPATSGGAWGHQLCCHLCKSAAIGDQEHEHQVSPSPASCFASVRYATAVNFSFLLQHNLIRHAAKQAASTQCTCPSYNVHLPQLGIPSCGRRPVSQRLLSASSAPAPINYNATWPGGRGCGFCLALAMWLDYDSLKVEARRRLKAEAMPES